MRGGVLRQKEDGSSQQILPENGKQHIERKEWNIYREIWNYRLNSQTERLRKK